jgi:hypothetical protein
MTPPRYPHERLGRKAFLKERDTFLREWAIYASDMISAQAGWDFARFTEDLASYDADRDQENRDLHRQVVDLEDPTK